MALKSWTSTIRFNPSLEIRVERLNVSQRVPAGFNPSLEILLQCCGSCSGADIGVGFNPSLEIQEDS